MTNDKGQMTKDKVTIPLIIAHRGASALAPENTLAAFRRAIDDGAEGIEFDVRVSKDGVAFVHHDGTLRRTGRKDISLADARSEQIADTDVGSWFKEFAPRRWRPEYGNETIPTLTSTLELLHGFEGRIYVELKSDEGQDLGDLVRSVSEVIRDSPLHDRIVVKSFRLAFIPLLRALCPDVKTAALFAPKIMTILRKEKYTVDLAAEFGADELSLHYTLATRNLMKNAEKRGLPVTIWTVNHPRWLRRGIKFGVKAIITNDPARLLAKRAEIIRGA